MWNGAAETLKARPQIRNTRPNRTPVLGAGVDRGGDVDEAARAGEAVDQRGAVEQQARRQRAQHEILQARLGGLARRRGGRRPGRRAPATAARCRRRARSGRRPRPSCPCRARPGAIRIGYSNRRCLQPVEPAVAEQDGHGAGGVDRRPWRRRPPGRRSKPPANARAQRARRRRRRRRRQSAAPASAMTARSRARRRRRPRPAAPGRRWPRMSFGQGDQEGS